MKKTESLMALLLVILMVTGCLFHPLEAYYNIIRCIHSVAALALVVCVIIHVKNRRTQWKNYLKE